MGATAIAKKRVATFDVEAQQPQIDEAYIRQSDWARLLVDQLGDPSNVTMALLEVIQLRLAENDRNPTHDDRARQALHDLRLFVDRAPGFKALEEQAQRHKIGMHLSRDVVEKLMLELLAESSVEMTREQIGQLTVAEAAAILATLAIGDTQPVICSQADVLQHLGGHVKNAGAMARLKRNGVVRKYWRVGQKYHVWMNSPEAQEQLRNFVDSKKHKGRER